MLPAESLMSELVERYERAYEAAARDLSLSPAQACLLGRLDHPHSMGGLAEELGCDASNVTQLIARLETLGLVVRETDPNDGRARLAARTPEGDEINSRFATSFSFARTALAQLTTAEQSRLTALLRKALSASSGDSAVSLLG
jgi:DNA-binding MarR family transcriptional regulator